MPPRSCCRAPQASVCRSTQPKSPGQALEKKSPSPTARETSALSPQESSGRLSEWEVTQGHRLPSDNIISTPGLQRPSRLQERLKASTKCFFLPASPRKVCLLSLSSSGYKETRDCQKALETAPALRAALPRTLQFALLRARADGLHQDVNSEPRF